MIKPIILKNADTEYTLEFNKESVKFAEMRGFKYEEVSDFPMTKIPEFFFYAFRMHHPNVARNQTDKILFEELGGIPNGLVDRLVELYLEPFNSLIGDEESEKNSKWTVEM